MQVVIRIITSLVFMTAVPFILINIFRKIDVETADEIKLSKKDIITLCIVAIAYSIVSGLIMCNWSTQQYINTALLMSYLVFMSYTDQKISELYTIVTICMILTEIILVALNLKNIYVTRYDLIIVVMLIAMTVASRFRLIGFGDILIYVVLSLYYVIYSNTAFICIVYNLLVANILFSIAHGIQKIMGKKTERHNPFTIYIAVSTLISSLCII